MNDSTSWETNFATEIQAAAAARSEGNEGKARVCARRAAGVVLREYLHRRQIEPSGPSAFAVLQTAQALPEISPEARQIIEHFLVRVNPDHDLPLDADLIAEARWLAENFLRSEI